MATRDPLVPLFAVLSLAFGCATPGRFVWVDDLSPDGAGDYRFATGDVLSVRVLGQDGASGKARVRDDGKISLPFVNDVEAAGRTAAELQDDMTARLSAHFQKPLVAVGLEEPAPVQVSVLGEVTRPGAYPMSPGAGVLHALAAAGGLTEYADDELIFVLRAGKDGSERVRFRYEDLKRTEGKGAKFRLRRGDVVVVE